MYLKYSSTNRTKGKSLSLICGSLTWVKDHEQKLLDECIEPERNITLVCSSKESAKGFIVASEPAWVQSHVREEKKKSRIQKRVELKSRLAKLRAKELKQKQRYENGQSFYKRQVSKPKSLR